VISAANGYFDGAGADPVIGEEIAYSYASASWVRDIEAQIWASLLVEPGSWAHNYAARAVALMKYAIANWPTFRTEAFGDSRREVVRALVSYTANDQYVYAALDLTDAYNANALIGGNMATRIQRHICFVPGGGSPFLCVLDEFSLSSPWIVRENIHTMRKAANVAGEYVFSDAAPSVDGVNQTASLVYDDASARVSMFGSSPLALSIFDDTDPPIQLAAWDTEGPLSTKLTVSQRVLCGFFNHIQAETAPGDTHLVGMVLCPYATGGTPPATSGVDNLDGTFTFSVDDWVGTVTLGDRPAFELGGAGGGDPATMCGLRGLFGPFSWLRYHVPAYVEPINLWNIVAKEYPGPVLRERDTCHFSLKSLR